MKKRIDFKEFFTDDPLSQIAASDFVNLSIPQKIQKINELVLLFPDRRKIDICIKCRTENGDWNKYNRYLEDGGTCSSCFRNAELINYSVIHLVSLAQLDPEDFYLYKDPISQEIFSGRRISCMNQYFENTSALKALRQAQEDEWFDLTEIYDENYISKHGKPDRITPDEMLYFRFNRIVSRYKPSKKQIISYELADKYRKESGIQYRRNLSILLITIGIGIFYIFLCVFKLLEFNKIIGSIFGVIMLLKIFELYNHGKRSDKFDELHSHIVSEKIWQEIVTSRK